MKIALISDTHGYLGQDVRTHLEEVDEIWHAGDIGDITLLEKMERMKPVRAVFGNIDDHKIRAVLPLNQVFNCEGVKVLMTHIGGYPGRYSKRVAALLDEHKPHLYICGHSHICKVVRDKKRDLIHMNPGACGHIGFHIMRTILLFECKSGSIQNLQVAELGRRGRDLQAQV